MELPGVLCATEVTTVVTVSGFTQASIVQKSVNLEMHFVLFVSLAKEIALLFKLDPTTEKEVCE